MSSFAVNNIDVATAHRAIEAAAAFALDKGWRMSICICDAEGEVKAFSRMDGSSKISVKIAMDKAHTSAALRAPTDAFYNKIKDDGPLINGIVHVDRVIVFGGGYPIMENGTCIGSIGVSGGYYTQDMECANAGLAAIA